MSSITVHGARRALVVPCPSCATVNRVPVRRLAERARCAHCKAALPLASPITLDGETFDVAIADAPIPVLVDFWATWCGPCHAMAPAFEAAARAGAGRVLFAKVDIDRAGDVARRFGIHAVPTVVRFSGGRETGRQAGAASADRLLAFGIG